MDFPSIFNFLTEFGCGFVLLRSFSPLFNFLGLLLMFTFCFKVLRFIWHVKGAFRFLCNSGGMPRFRFCLNNVVWEVSKPKPAPLKKGRHPNSSSSVRKSSKTAGKKVNANLEDGSEGKGENDREVWNEDEVVDAATLRKLVKIERQKANSACAELEKERTAAASSADEAMAMILRLQSEKSAAEIQATQFRRMAEQELEYDHEVIDSLQWTISHHESDKISMEEQVEIYREELKQFMSEEEIKQIEDEISREYGYDEDPHNSDPHDSAGSPLETESQTLSR